MAAPDPYAWYTLHLGTSTTQALSSNGTSTSALSIAAANASSPSQHWQFFPLTITLPFTTSTTASNGTGIKQTYYTLRSASSGPSAFLGTHNPSYTLGSSLSTKDSNATTLPWLVAGDAADQSVLWQLGQWDDGSWWMSNVRNGTAWRMGWESGGSGKTVMREDGEEAKWGLKEVGKVEDAKFGSLELFGSLFSLLPSISPTSTPKPTTTSSTAATHQPSNTNPSASTSTPSTLAVDNSNMSTQTQAVVGATIGGIVLLAFFVVIFVIWRKRQGLAGHGRPREVAIDSTSTARPMFELFSERVDGKGSNGTLKQHTFAKEIVVDVEKHGGLGTNINWKGKGAQAVDVHEWEKAAKLAGVGKRKR